MVKLIFPQFYQQFKTGEGLINVIMNLIAIHSVCLFFMRDYLCFE